MTTQNSYLQIYIHFIDTHTFTFELNVDVPFVCIHVKSTLHSKRWTKRGLSSIYMLVH